MKKTIFFSFMLCVLFSFAVSAQDFEFRGTKGVLLDDTVYCNDYFLWCSSFSKKIYECHGHEYGCTYTGQECIGTVHVVGGYAYFGFTKIQPGYDTSGLCLQYIPISLSTWSGTGEWQYVYMWGGVMSSHGGTSTYNLSFGPDPGSSRSPVDPNNAKK
jgi:hypothetical protein